MFLHRFYGLVTDASICRKPSPGALGEKDHKGVNAERNCQRRIACISAIAIHGPASLPRKMWKRTIMSIGGESSARPNGAVRWNQRSLLLSDVRLNADPVVDCVLKALPTAEVFLGRLNRDVAEQDWIWSRSPPASRHRRAQVRRRSCGARFSISALLAQSF
jgi:hypothetical protein